MQFMTFLPPLCKMFVFMWNENNYKCTFLNHIQFLPLTNQHYVHQRWNLHLSYIVIHNQPNTCKFSFLVLHSSRICYFWCKLKKGAITTNPIDQFLLLTIEILGCLHKYVNVYINTPMPFKTSKGHRALPFYLGYICSLKNFNYVAKDASIFHLKSSNSGKPSYFSTSTPSWHTTHCHIQPIISGW
jgi:hypothetical protein